MKIRPRDLTIRHFAAGTHDNGETSQTIDDTCQILSRKCNREKSAQ